jgi:hypothetical protein
MRLALALLCLATAATAAETQMTVAEFEAWSTGKTLTYTLDGALWGSEMHGTDRATMDDGDGDICRAGLWYPQGNDICFSYEMDPGPFCWRFFTDGNQVFAQYADGSDAPRYAVTLSDTPVSCTPEVGV